MRGHDPMMEPNFYHLWSGYLREHGYEGAGDYWTDPIGRPHSFRAAIERVYLEQAPARMMVGIRAASEAFLEIAMAALPAIRAANAAAARMSHVPGEEEW